MISIKSVKEEKQYVLFPGIMNERLLQFIWQHQYFNTSGLQTTTGEEVRIISPGRWNYNQGPDFLDAQVSIGNIILAGSVELHLKSSQWKEHGHQQDPNYANVVLHVVLEHNDTDTSLPVLELKGRISVLLLERYASLMHSSSFIPCSAASLYQVKDITWISWKERLIIERLVRKSEQVLNYQDQNSAHWEESFWWLLARNFGLKINSDAFEAIARSLPLPILARHKDRIQQLEALLLGQAGLLGNKFREDYPRMLYREYQHLKKKYRLQPIHHPVHFLRMRPGNFPTIRLAQLAGVIHRSIHLFSVILETVKASELRKLFEVEANDYWLYHYMFDEPSAYKKKTLGRDMIDNLIINTIVPVLFAYGLYHKAEDFRTRALQWLGDIPSEHNTITTGFEQLKIENRRALDSQALIELKARYCDHKRCLECAVGNVLLKQIG